MKSKTNARDIPFLSGKGRGQALSFNELLMDFNGDLEGLCPVCTAKFPRPLGRGSGGGTAHGGAVSSRTTDRIEDTTGDAGVSPAVSLAQTV